MVESRSAELKRPARRTAPGAFTLRSCRALRCLFFNIAFLGASLGCSAPEVAPLPTERQAPPPKTQADDGPPAAPSSDQTKTPPEAAPADEPNSTAETNEADVQTVEAPHAEPTEAVAIPPIDPAKAPLIPTPKTDLPPAPFSAWTTQAPLTLVGPGGQRVGTILRLGTRVEVLQVLDGRMRVRCLGCPRGQRTIEAWIPHGSLRAARTMNTIHDPLTVILKKRARWAAEQEMPEGVRNAAMCQLVDLGFEREGPKATWAANDGRVEMEHKEGSWQITSVRAPKEQEPWECAAPGHTGGHMPVPREQVQGPPSPG